MFTVVEADDGSIPSRLAFARDESVIGIDRFVAARRERDLVPRLFTLQRPRAPALVLPFLDLPCRHHDRLESEGLDQAPQLGRHRVVRTLGTEGNAGPKPGHRITRPAGVPNQTSVAASGTTSIVRDQEQAPAARATQ